MNLSITQEITGKKIIATYITEGEFTHLETICYSKGDSSLPGVISGAHPDVDYFMVAYMKAESTNIPTVTICDQMNSRDVEGDSNGLVVVYNLYEGAIVETEPTKGDVKLGAG